MYEYYARKDNSRNTNHIDAARNKNKQKLEKNGSKMH